MNCSSLSRLPCLSATVLYVDSIFRSSSNSPTPSRRPIKRPQEMQEKHRPVDDERATPLPQQDSNWFSKAVFHWTFDLLKVHKLPSSTPTPMDIMLSNAKHIHSAVSGSLSNPKTSQAYIPHTRLVALLRMFKPPSSRTMQSGRRVRCGLLSTPPSNGSSGSVEHVVARQTVCWFWCRSSLAT